MKTKYLIGFALVLIAAAVISPVVAVALVLLACAPFLLRTNQSFGLKNLVNRADGTIVTDLQNFLIDQIALDGNAETLKAIGEKKIFFDTITYYIKFNITGASGKQKILDEGTKKQVSVTNFNLGYLPKFQNFAFNKIGVSYATTNTANAAVGSMVGWTKVRGSFDAALQNAELIISKARNICYESPISPMLREAALTSGASLAGDYELEQPRLLKENELVEMEINYGANTVLNTVNTTQAVLVELSGIQIRLKG